MFTCPSPRPDTEPVDFPQLHCIGSFYAKLKQSVARHRDFLTATTLAEIDGDYPLLLLHPPSHLRSKPSLLIAAGFHGEEAAGPWGIVSFLEKMPPAFFDKCNISILPLVNPTGFVRGQRLNKWLENPNRHFIATADEYCSPDSQRVSREGFALIENIELIRDSARDGFLSLHEDWRLTSAYLYGYTTDLPSQTSVASALRHTLASHFTVLPDGINPMVSSTIPINNGCVWNEFDGSFEDFLFARGTVHAYCTETPGQKLASERVACNAALAATFVDQFAK